MIGRPRQWTASRSRKLARLYLYSMLSIEKIIKVLENDSFRPRKNSAQKAINKMLDNDPRYLRPNFWPSAAGLSGSASPASRPHSCITDGCCVLAYHARLVQTIQSAYTNPAVEDDEGRNGLHCLAEAILDQDTMDRLHIPDEQDGKARTLQTILETLIRRGGYAAWSAQRAGRDAPADGGAAGAQGRAVGCCGRAR
ncbi:hypothetical protein NEMBOFW57_004141 [Staphylotrichum longicolle]|uniref:Uncharacterized protein n=1 Tax=Staphylotrichum longicolle TaxID=669026 RepID=A0AAD4I062_9PEZI|nr:hypothetical protein NEMBOFW57_004141 [Staphylotrichum longicolle]